MDVSETIRGILIADPERNVMEWQGKWWTRGSLSAFAGALGKELDRLGVTPDMAVAVAARNRPNHCYTVLTLLAGERPVSMLYAFQAPESLARDITSTRFAVLVLDEQDWSDAVATAAEETGTPVILLGASTAGRTRRSSRRSCRRRRRSGSCRRTSARR